MMITELFLIPNLLVAHGVLTSLHVHTAIDLDYLSAYIA